MILPFDYIGYKRLSENKVFLTTVGTATPPGGKWGFDIFNFNSIHLLL
jgi:hypothetical protein